MHLALALAASFAIVIVARPVEDWDVEGDEKTARSEHIIIACLSSDVEESAYAHPSISNI